MKRRESLLSALLLAGVAATPVAFGAFVLGGVGAQGMTLLPSAAVGALGAGTQTEPQTNPFFMGVLYLNGQADVEWNGTRIPLAASTYAYSGGEVVRTGPESMGVLQLGSAGAVYLCPGTTARVVMEGGRYGLQVSGGTARYAFSPTTDFTLDVNGNRLAPRGDGAEAFVGEAASRDGDTLVCALSRALALEAVEGVGGDRLAALGNTAAGRCLTVAADAGAQAPGVETWALPRDGGDGAWQVSRVPLPDQVMDGLTLGYPPGAGAAPDYLCRAEDLLRAALASLSTVAQTGDPEPPPQTEPPVPPPQIAPPPPAPGVPPLALALPGPPGIDPTLTPPAAGPDGSGTGSPSLTVLPPSFAPLGGSGGGVVASPS